MRGTILQPGYFPWLGFFNQMANSDIFVFLEDVQFDRRGWRNRNRVKGVSSPILLTVPIQKKGRYEQSLMETRIDNTVPWVRKHLKTIQFNYRKSPYFDRYYPDLEKCLTTPWEFLLDLDLALIECHMSWLGLQVKTLRSSNIHVEDMDKTGRLVEICLKAGITDYISGPLCTDYMEYAQFKSADVRLWLHRYVHPEYSQLHSKFEPYMAALDLLFNMGDESLAILKQESALTEYTGEESSD